MPPLGAHFSVAGGLVNAVRTAVRFSCQTLQLFTKNTAQWAAPPLKPDDVRAFRTEATAAKLVHLTAHDSYLINLAAPGDELFQKSINAFVIEMERAEELGLEYLVTHPGAHVGSGEEEGLKRVVKGLDETARRTRGLTPLILLETTAGQGSCLGYRFEHLAYLLEHVAEPERFAVCFDTCHVFAGGYDLRTAAATKKTLAEFDTVIGLDRLKLFHLNDSVKGLGSRVDRHAAIGEGEIGEAAFRFISTDRRFAGTPMILETPKHDSEGNELDPVNLGRLRAFAGG
ncbi:MAG: deoxyribonuclease IV [Fimbriiglobus sp.]|nr:deoxyribonuclease IV [Fimbriiglobus sp.]